MLELIPLALTLVALAGYGTGLHRLRRRGLRWPVTRVAAMLAGALCTAAAVLPPIASHDELFPVHVAQHLHGGLGADIDYPVHRYFLWGKQIEDTLGGASAQLARLGAELAGATR